MCTKCAAAAACSATWHGCRAPRLGRPTLAATARARRRHASEYGFVSSRQTSAADCSEGAGYWRQCRPSRPSGIACAGTMGKVTGIGAKWPRVPCGRIAGAGAAAAAPTTSVGEWWGIAAAEAACSASPPVCASGGAWELTEPPGPYLPAEAAAAARRASPLRRCARLSSETLSAVEAKALGIMQHAAFAPAQRDGL